MSLSQITRRLGIATNPANRQKDDYYLRPPEATRALLSVESFDGPIWEPCCGEANISTVLCETGYALVSTDLVDRGYGEPRVDFLMEWQPLAPNIVTSPPYRHVEPFMRAGLRLMTGKMALLRLACLEGVERWQIYETSPLARMWVFERRHYFRCERTNAAARRFISKSTVVAISRRDVVEFLQRRRDPLPAIQIGEWAEEALQRFLRLRRKHYRGYRRGDEGAP